MKHEYIVLMSQRKDLINAIKKRHQKHMLRLDILGYHPSKFASHILYMTNIYHFLARHTRQTTADVMKDLSSRDILYLIGDFYA